jgi:urease accessory protein
MDAVGSVVGGLTTPASTLGRVGRDGCLHLRFERRHDATVLARCAYTLPLQVLAPLRLPDPATVVSVLNPGGGIVGGDRLTVDVDVGSGAHACLTTPSATKVYRTLGPEARQDVRLRVAPGGALEWVPDHTIVFAGSAFRQTMDADVQRGGRLILLDSFAAGRVAREGAWRFAWLESAITIREGPRWILHDRFVLDPDGPWAGIGCSDGYAYFGALVVIGEIDVSSLARAATSTLKRDGVKGAAAAGPRGGLIARVLAVDAPSFMSALDAIWSVTRRAVLDLPPLPLRKP